MRSQDITLLFIPCLSAVVHGRTDLVSALFKHVYSFFQQKLMT